MAIGFPVAVSWSDEVPLASETTARLPSGEKAFFDLVIAQTEVECATNTTIASRYVAGLIDTAPFLAVSYFVGC
jgi:hypothetical protein